jgi:hypothetical protein
MVASAIRNRQLAGLGEPQLVLKESHKNQQPVIPPGPRPLPTPTQSGPSPIPNPNSPPSPEATRAERPPPDGRSPAPSARRPGRRPAPSARRRRRRRRAPSGNLRRRRATTRPRTGVTQVLSEVSVGSCELCDGGSVLGGSSEVAGDAFVSFGHAFSAGNDLPIRGKHLKATGLACRCGLRAGLVGRVSVPAGRAPSGHGGCGE